MRTFIGVLPVGGSEAHGPRVSTSCINDRRSRRQLPPFPHGTREGEDHELGAPVGATPERRGSKADDVGMAPATATTRDA
jgi:hypothetical protein